MTLLVLDVVCPRCGKAPNLRIFPIQQETLSKLHPETPLTTWECQRKGCRETVVITAAAYQNARSPDGRAA